MMPSLRASALASASFLLAVGSFAFASPQNHKNLSARDADAVRATLQRYRSAWLAGDADAVRANFTPDAVLMPHHGLEPIVGMKAINDFWWPPSTAKTTITKFVQTVDEVGGTPALAYVRGRSEVAWTIEDQGKREKWRTGGNFLALLKKQADGRWLISHLIWDDPPNELVK